MKTKLTIFCNLFLFFSFLLLSACGGDNQSSNTPTPSTGETLVSTPAVQANPTNASGYPAPNVGLSDPAYPAPSDTGETFLVEPPNPERELPATEADKGAFVGVLVQEVGDKGFVPMDPYELILAKVLTNSNGESALFSYGEDSIKGETFPTGVFVFQNVPPGTYGLVVNLAAVYFPVKVDGKELIITVEAGKAIDLGQIIIESP